MRAKSALESAIISTYFFELYVVCIGKMTKRLDIDEGKMKKDLTKNWIDLVWENY